MKWLFLFSLLFQIQALAFNNFIGNYKYVSGPKGTIGCGNLSVQLDKAKDGLEVYYLYPQGERQLVYSLPAINKGKVDWIYNWGDGIARGKQETKFFGQTITHDVTKLVGMYRLLSRKMTLAGNYLTIDYWSRDAVSKCVLQRF